MKTLILLIFSLLIFNTSNAQYQSALNDTNQYWKVYKVQSALGVEVYADSLYLDSNIQFNNQQYTILRSWRSGLSNPSNLLGFLREDTTQGKLWHLPDTFGFRSEHLVYDFSLAVGDTFDVPANGPIRFIVERRDTALGNQRMVLKSINDTMQVFYPFLAKTYYPIDTLVFMEGIGSSKGLDNRLFRKINTGEESDLLLCHFKNGTQTFQHQLSDSLPFLGLCDTVIPLGIVGLEKKSVTQQQLTAYPIPVANRLYVDGVFEAENIQLFDISGKPIREFNPCERSWEVSALKPGMYLLRITTLDGEVLSKKVVKR